MSHDFIGALLIDYEETRRLDRPLNWGRGLRIRSEFPRIMSYSVSIFQGGSLLINNNITA